MLDNLLTEDEVTRRDRDVVHQTEAEEVLKKKGTKWAHS